MKTLAVATLLFAALVSAASAQATLKLEAGDTICLVGGAMGESVDREGTFEALLHARFPEHNLKVRSLCYPGDEVVRRPRAPGFPSAIDTLTREEASVIIGLFGFNESWAGQDGIEAFKLALDNWIVATLQATYRGDDGGSPRVALATPTAFEPFPHGPDVKRLNNQIRPYADAVRGAAAKHQLPLADLYAATEKLYAAGKGMTANGVTPNATGAARIGLALDAALFGRASNKAPSEALLESVRAKSALFRDRYRPANSDAIFGARAALAFEPDRTLTNGTVLNKELEIRDALVASADAAIWATAAGNPAPAPAAAKPPGATAVESNFGSGRNRGKEGSTTYLKPSQARGRFRPAEGYSLDLWASELDFPELTNPTASCFDAAGRLWVACAPSYPGRAPGEAPTDRVIVLDDFDNDGRADRCRVFADGLDLPTGIAVGDGGVYVAAAPDLLFLQDTDGDFKADTRTALLTGFGRANAHHAINSLTWGPGGALYFGEGSFDQSSIETAHGTVRVSNSGIYRYHPVSRTLERYITYNFTNPHGICFDEWGNSVIADAATGSFYLGNTLSGATFENDKHGAARSFAKARNNPIAGATFVHGSHFPKDAQGDLIAGSCIAMLGALHFDIRYAESGPLIVAEETAPIFLTTDGNFRPVDVDFGPDGALFVTDWHNALLGHFEHHLRDPNRDKTHGRIWRATYRSRRTDEWPAIEGASPRDLIPLLTHGNDLVRGHAKRELRQHPAGPVLAAALKWGASLDKAGARYEHHLMEILNLHAHFAHPNTAILRAALRAKRPEARAAATRLLAQWRDAEPGALSMLKVLVTDPDARVQLEAIRACTFFDDPRALETVRLAAPAEDADPLEGALAYVFKEAVTALEKRFPPAPDDPAR